MEPSKDNDQFDAAINMLPAQTEQDALVSRALAPFKVSTLAKRAFDCASRESKQWLAGCECDVAAWRDDEAAKRQRR